MKRELGIARCGLACCLCSGNDHCNGCDSEDCPDRERCANRRCSMERGIEACYACEEQACRTDLLSHIKPLGFTEYVRRYGREALLDRLEENERNGVVYHREGLMGDYDDFTDVEALIAFIESGRKE